MKNIERLPPMNEVKTTPLLCPRCERLQSPNWPHETTDRCIGNLSQVVADQQEEINQLKDVVIEMGRQLGVTIK